jgi:hypothetical protein
MRPQASEVEARSMDHLRVGRFGQGGERPHCGWHGQGRAGSESRERDLC